ARDRTAPARHPPAPRTPRTPRARSRAWSRSGPCPRAALRAASCRARTRPAGPRRSPVESHEHVLAPARSFARSWGGEPAHPAFGQRVRDFGYGLRTVGPVPARSPVDGAKHRARDERGIGRSKLAAPHARDYQCPHRALVSIALADDRSAQRLRQRLDFEVSGRALQVVEHAVHVGPDDGAQALRERSGRTGRVLCRGEQALERALLAELQDLVFPGEVVIEIAGQQARFLGNLADARARNAESAEHAAGGTQDLEAARFVLPLDALRGVGRI